MVNNAFYTLKSVDGIEYRQCRAKFVDKEMKEIYGMFSGDVKLALQFFSGSNPAQSWTLGVIDNTPFLLPVSDCGATECDLIEKGLKVTLQIYGIFKSTSRESSRYRFNIFEQSLIKIQKTRIARSVQ